MPKRFSDQHGVDVRIQNYARTESAPFYEPMYEALESVGYVRNKDIRVAGYDSRLTPDMGNFLNRAKRLIEDTYRDNGKTPVHLVGHSNGPLYIQYLLTHVSQGWKDKYIHGFTPFAGNFPGRTHTMPLAIYIANEIDPDEAIVLSLVLIAVSFAVLVALRDRFLGGGNPPRP